MSRIAEANRAVIKIGMVGKYTGLSDSYLSVLKALEQAALACEMKVEIKWIVSSDLETDESDAWATLKEIDGILVPGGFGVREFMAAKYARENNVPYLGVCLGMQIAVQEFTRNVSCNGANDVVRNFNMCSAVISMPEISKSHKGGTMRLGSRRTFFHTSTAKLYQAPFVDERYRQNPVLVEELEKAGLAFVGRDKAGKRMEIVEIPKHKYFVGVQYHPEFKSRPGKPSAIFLGLVLAAFQQLESFVVKNPENGSQAPLRFRV